VRMKNIYWFMTKNLLHSFDSDAPESFQGGTVFFPVLEDKGQDIIEQNNICVLKKYNQSLTESSNSSKLIHDSFDFQEVSVQEKFKIDDEKLGIQGFTYHQQMQSFFLDKDNKEEQISQTTSSEIFNNHDQKDDFAVGYDQSIEEKVVFQKHHATIITYQEDIIINDDIKDIFVSNSSKELAVHEEHEQFKESVFGVH
jgi:hypothetical protein